MVKRGEDPALVQEVHTTSFIYGLVPNSAENAEDLRNTLKRREHRSAENIGAQGTSERTERRSAERRSAENIEAHSMSKRTVC